MLASRDLKPMRRKSDAIVWRPNTTDRMRKAIPWTTGARPTRDHGITLIRNKMKPTNPNAHTYVNGTVSKHMVMQ